MNIESDDSRTHTTPVPMYESVCPLGTADEVRTALMDGGHTIVSLMKAKNLTITRSRGQQYAASVGVHVSGNVRTVLWHANALTGRNRPELARNLTDKVWVLAQVRSAGSVENFARTISVDRNRLWRYLRKCIHLSTKMDKRPTQMRELACTVCQKKILRRLKMIEQAEKHNPGRIVHFRCKVCHGKWLGSLKRKSKAQSLTPPSH